MTRRFECILDPSERYLIWDNECDLPVLLDGNLLTHPNKQEAERIARLLDACERARLELRTLVSPSAAEDGCPMAFSTRTQKGLAAARR